MGGPNESPVFHHSAQKSQVFASFRRLENRHPLTQHTQAWGDPPGRGDGCTAFLCDMSILAPPPSPLSLFTKCRPSLRLACT